MEWLRQNWVFILLVVGAILWMRRGGMGCGHGGGGHRHDGSGEGGHHPEAGSNIDPVSGQAVDPQTAVTSAYQGKTYYFATRENRDRFEAAPEQYAAKPPEQQGQRHGCC
jgi:YHS domain-containing protein